MEPQARSTDPSTSHQAAHAARGMAEQHHKAILACLRAYGPKGKDALGNLTRLGGVACARRLTELHRKGLIEPTGRTVESYSGRAEREWRLA